MEVAVSGVRTARIVQESSEEGATDDGIALALLTSMRDLGELVQQIEALAEAYARRRGVTIAA